MSSSAHNLLNITPPHRKLTFRRTSTLFSFLLLSRAVKVARG